jgi:hypothetical protein
MTTRLFIILALLLPGLCLGSAPASAQEFTELDGTPIDSRLRRAWAGNWRDFARSVAPFEDGYIVVPNYDRRTPSSLGMSERDAIEKLTETYTETTGIIRETRTWTPPREEAEAYANTLPKMDLGTYGYIHSVEVVEVLGPEQMLVKNIWLIDGDAVERAYERELAELQMQERRNGRNNRGGPDARAVVDARYAMRLAVVEYQQNREFGQTCRLVGYDTRGLQPGQRYAGPRDEGFQVAVAKWDHVAVPAEDEAQDQAEEDDRPRRSSRRSDEPDPMLVLVDPLPVMRVNTTEEQFIEMLDKRGLKIVEFIELVRELREADRETSEELIFNELLPPKPEDDD